MPVDSHDGMADCERPILFIEAGPQASLAFYPMVFDIISIDATQNIPVILSFLDFGAGHTPPPPFGLSARTILRV